MSGLWIAAIIRVCSKPLRFRKVWERAAEHPGRGPESESWSAALPIADARRIKDYLDCFGV